MNLSEHIAALIEKMLEEGGGRADVRRNDLAQKLGCVPSQISYVITSRFTPARGYMTDSRRGGGGCIHIVRVEMGRSEYLMHFFHALGDAVTEPEAAAFLKNLHEYGWMSENEAKLIRQAVSQGALEACPPERRDALRAGILRHVLMARMMQE